MSGYWILPGQSTVCVDDAVLQGVDCSTIPSNIYIIRWSGQSGEILYNHDDRLPVREPVTDFAAYVKVFDNWMLAAMDPQVLGRTLKGSPAITLAQAKAVKSKLVWGLYYNKFEGLSPGTPPGDNTASVNASIQALVQSTNNVVQGLATAVNNFTLSSDGARSSDAGNLNASLSSQATAHNANVANVNQNNVYLRAAAGFPISVPNDMGGIGTPSMPTLAIGGGISAGGVSAPPVTPGGAGTGPTDPLAPVRDAHLNNIAALTTVPAVAAYDITAGW
jgi:hypothetical protein